MNTYEVFYFFAMTRYSEETVTPAIRRTGLANFSRVASYVNSRLEPVL